MKRDGSDTMIDEAGKDRPDSPDAADARDGTATGESGKHRQAVLAAQAQRKARAAAKLRENLARRKVQTRARRKGEAETGTGLPASEPASLSDDD